MRRTPDTCFNSPQKSLQCVIYIFTPDLCRLLAPSVHDIIHHHASSSILASFWLTEVKAWMPPTQVHSQINWLIDWLIAYSKGAKYLLCHKPGALHAHFTAHNTATVPDPNTFYTIGSADWLNWISLQQDVIFRSIFPSLRCPRHMEQEFHLTLVTLYKTWLLSSSRIEFYRLYSFAEDRTNHHALKGQDITAVIWLDQFEAMNGARRTMEVRSSLSVSKNWDLCIHSILDL